MQPAGAAHQPTGNAEQLSAQRDSGGAVQVGLGQDADRAGEVVRDDL